MSYLGSFVWYISQRVYGKLKTEPVLHCNLSLLL